MIRKQYYPDTDIRNLFAFHQCEKPPLEFVDACAHIYAVLATVFNPNALIIGGGVMEMQDFPRAAFERAVHGKAGRDVMSYGFDFVYSKESMEKGIVGAAIFARGCMCR